MSQTVVVSCKTELFSAGVTFDHSLLPVDVIKMRGLEAVMRTRVLGVLRALVVHLTVQHSDSSILTSILQRIEAPLQVHGAVEIEQIRPYTSYRLSEGKMVVECMLCNKTSRKMYDAKIHVLREHFDWRVQCPKAFCPALVKVQVSGVPYGHHKDHELAQ